MTTSGPRATAVVATAMAIASLAPVGRAAARSADQKPAGIAGRWALDKAHSALPDDIGFDVMVEGEGQSPENAAARSRGSRGASNPSTSAFVAREDEQTIRVLNDVTDEAKHPWPVLTIDDANGVVTLTDGGQLTRRFHPGKSDEERFADGSGITTRAKWDKGQLVVDYEVEANRVVRYTYARASDAAPLEVDVSFRDHGRGAVVRRTYTPADR